MMRGTRFTSHIPAVLALYGGVAEAQSLRILAPLDQAFGFEAFGISANGQYASGYSSDAATGESTALRWNANATPTPLARHSVADIAYAVSDDGRTCAGESNGTAIVWRDAGDLLLGPGAVLDLDASGSVAIGRKAGPGGLLRGFVHAGSLLELQPVSGDAESRAAGVSSGGQFVVGASTRTVGTTFRSRACVWNASGGQPVELTPFEGGIVASASDVSADGRVVVGTCTCCSGTGVTAIRWVDGVPQDLTPGVFSGYAMGVSDDGSVVVGEASHRAFVWDPVNGRRDLRDLLSLAGVDMSNIVLVAARRVSADGRTIVGNGFYADTLEGIAWRVSFDPHCAADFNGDAQADFFDYLDFAQAFADEQPGADFNGDQQIDFFDYLDFAVAFAAGCE